jgi:hypothetical protein
MNRKRRMPSARANRVTRLIEALDEYLENFDTSDPEYMQVQLDEAVSGILKDVRPANRRVPQFEDALVIILGGSPPDEAYTYAQTARQLIESYGDKASESDMDEAYSQLEAVVQSLRELKAESE